MKKDLLGEAFRFLWATHEEMKWWSMTLDGTVSVSQSLEKPFLWDACVETNEDFTGNGADVYVWGQGKTPELAVLDLVQTVKQKLSTHARKLKAIETRAARLLKVFHDHQIQFEPPTKTRRWGNRHGPKT